MKLVLDTAASHLKLWTYKEGLLSRVAHDLCLSASSFGAELELEGERFSVQVRVPVRGLRVEGQVKQGVVAPLSAKDHREIEKNLGGKKVLDADRHPDIVFRAEGARGDGATLEVSGELTLRGRARPLRLTTTLARDGGGYRAEGEVRLLQTDYGVTPFSAMLGALKVQDGVRISWSLRYSGGA